MPDDEPKGPGFAIVLRSPKGPGFGLTIGELQEMAKAFKDASGACSDLQDIAKQPDSPPALQQAAQKFGALKIGFAKIEGLWKTAADNAAKEEAATLEGLKKEVERLEGGRAPSGDAKS